MKYTYPSVCQSLVLLGLALGAALFARLARLLALGDGHLVPDDASFLALALQNGTTLGKHLQVSAS